MVGCTDVKSLIQKNQKGCLTHTASGFSLPDVLVLVIKMLKLSWVLLSQNFFKCFISTVQEINPLQLDCDGAKPYQIYVKQRSCADVISPTSEKLKEHQQMQGRQQN
jgi:hypothetical protein